MEEGIIDMPKYPKYPGNVVAGGLRDIAQQAHVTAQRHGFWNQYANYYPLIDIALIKLALIASEIGEAVEAARDGAWEDFAEELADICIRVFDLAGALNIDIQTEIISKMAYNEGRSHMHGKGA